ncbi:MAG: zinc-dependent metalloprotease, partial [Chitinophagaceae bacterium]|nr:zinc-dependent metalloprotease [Chitinophagaceae bacterium]
RYQLEAATKLVGGMNYTYASRGDGQLVTAQLPKKIQQEALNEIIRSISPEVLELPDAIIKLIPPRPAGYDVTRELFKKRTGFAFDALSPAETAVDLPLSFLFNSERLSRMAQHELTGGLSIREMVDTLVKSTWKSTPQTGMKRLIQLQSQQVLLTYLLAASVDDNSSFAVRASLQKSLSDLKSYLEGQKKQSKDISYLGYVNLALERMKAPDKAKPTIHAAIPPGAPIGCDWD